MNLAGIGQFLSGALFMACLAAGLLFLRSYRRTHDRLFFFFAVAFLIFGLNRVVFLFFPQAHEAHLIAYGSRLLAFGLILFAMVDKNRTRRDPRSVARRRSIRARIGR